jgi:phage repressor protein C with HTH and peptisase S24 domain
MIERMIGFYLLRQGENLFAIPIQPGDNSRMAENPRELIQRLVDMRDDLTLADLSRALGLNHAYFQQYVSGRSPKKGLPEDIREATAEILGVDADLLRETRKVPLGRARDESAARDVTAVTKSSRNRPPKGAVQVEYGSRDFPIYGSSQAGAEGQVVDYDHAIEYRHRPPELIGVSGAWGMYVVGDSMEPRYFHGDRVHINPHKPVRAGRFVVIVKHDNTALVKQFVARSDNRYKLRQLNPKRDIEIPAADVQGCYLVVGSTDAD